MDKITIYKPESLELVVVDGNPPVDQTALVAQLQATISNLENQVAVLNAKINAAKAALE